MNMRKIIFLISLSIISNSAVSKTVADFINEHPELAKRPTIKAGIQQGAIGNAALDAMSNGATSETLSADSQRLLAENGYEYAQAALRELATSTCDDDELSQIYGLRKKDCQTIIKIDSEIE